MAPDHASAAGLQEEDSGNLFEDDDFAPLDRESRGRWRRTVPQVMIVGFASGIGLALLSMALRATRSAPAASWTADAEEVIDEFAKCGDVFQQCGGSGFTGAKCCKAGCICMVKNGFFSSCKPAFPGGGCNPAAAQGKADSILKAAIGLQVDAHKDAKQKRDALEKAADAAEHLAKAARRHADLAAKESSAAQEAYAAIKRGNGRQWYKAVSREGAHARKDKEAADETTDAYNEFSSVFASSSLVANNFVEALAKANKLAGEEKQWAENLAQDAKWTPISGYEDVSGGGSDSGGSDDSSPDDDKLVGGVYFTR